MFHFNGPNCELPQQCPPGFHYYFDYVAETQFQFGSVENLLNTDASCRITRGESGKHRAFFGINNFLQLPHADVAPTINAIDFLKSRVETCMSLNGGIDVSFLYADHWSIGDLLAFANEYNRQLG